jgi:phage host-nuclease inhibitor protein Gam
MTADAATPELIPIADDDACAAAIGEIARVDADLQRIEADKNQAVLAAAKSAEDKAGPLSAQRVLLERSVEAYCTANRDRLTDGGKRKFAPFATGEGQWRKGRDSVDIDDAESDAIVKKLKAMGKAFARFIRVKETPSKTAIGAATDAEKVRLRKIKGLSFKPGAEIFEVKPAALPLAERPQ